MFTQKHDIRSLSQHRHNLLKARSLTALALVGLMSILAVSAAQAGGRGGIGGDLHSASGGAKR